MRTFLALSDSTCALLGAAFLLATGVAACGGGSGGTSTKTSSTGGAGSTSTSATGTGAVSSDNSSSTSSTMSSSSTGGSSTAITCTGQPSTLSLSGTWAAVAQLSVNLQGVPGGAITICPANQVGSATLALLVTIQQDATDPTKLDQVQATLCSVTLPTTTALVGTCDPTSPSLVTTQLIVPQAFLDALPKVATGTGLGTVGGTAAGATITLDALDVVAGSTMSGANLPKWDTSSSSCNMPNIGESMSCDTTCVSDCNAMRDDDMDGYPGVTIEVCGETADDKSSGAKCNAATPQDPGVSLQGQGFIDFEVNPSVTGTVKSSCEITGSVASQISYNLVGANVFLAGSPINVSSAIESLPTFQVDPTASKAVLVRIDGQYGAPNWMVDPTDASAACKTVNMRINQL